MSKAKFVFAALLLVLPVAASSQEDAASVAPPFTEGDILSFEQLEQLRPYLPEEFWANRDFFFFEGMQLEIGPFHADYSPADAFRAASDRFKGEPKIGPDGSLENYTAGMPFDMEAFDCQSDPDAAVKLMWNFSTRWSGGGGQARFLYTYWDRGRCPRSRGAASRRGPSRCRGSGPDRRHPTSGWRSST